MSLIRGGDGEWQAATICNRGNAGSIPTPASNFAVLTGAQTPARTFNHTAEAAWPSNQEYMASAVSFPRKARTQWTNNRNENNAVW